MTEKNQMQLLEEIKLLKKRIEELGKVTEELRKNETKFRILTENLPQKIFLKDRNSVYISCNKNYARDLNISPDEIAGKMDYDFYPKELAEKYRTDDKRCVESGKTENIEEKYIQEGKERIVQTVKVPIRDERGEITGILGIFWDITERKAAEEALKKAYAELKETQQELIISTKIAALGRFATGIAHEVKNPLGIILGGAEFLETKLPKADKTVRETLAKIRESVLRADSILKSFLLYAKPSPVKIVKVPLNDLAREVSSLAGYKTFSENIGLKTELTEENICVEADRDQMYQVIFNIAINSIDATPKGGEITIRTYKEKTGALLKGRPACVIEIIDTGAGIPQENMAKLFEPFFTTKERTVGKGLGLFIAKTIMDNYGGEIIVDSVEGKGTDVKVVLPCAP
ncbi:MAG: PAS domain-containing protein [Candidatus Omnitrophica bacterium]|nr:PAS domain-containing protein [Candidatus Omnitrophota bacterium]